MDPISAVIGALGLFAADRTAAATDRAVRKAGRKVSKAFRLDEMAEGYVRFIEGRPCVGGHDWMVDSDDDTHAYCRHEGCDATRKVDFMKRYKAGW